MIDYLEKFLSDQNLKKEDVCIVGSFALETHNIRKAKDIDIIISQNKRQELGLGFNSTKVSEHVEVVSIGWAIKYSITDDEIIYNDKFHEIFRGYKVVKIDLVFRKKHDSFRRKDIIDIKDIAKRYPELKIKKKKNHVYYFNGLKRIYSRVKAKVIRPLVISKSFIKSCKLPSVINLHLSPNFMLSNEYNKNDLFMRYDIIIRYKTIENYICKQNDAFDTYDKMQLTRNYINKVRHNSERFAKLIDSVKTLGFNETIISISSNGRLIDGSHRLAVALFFDVNTVKINLNRHESKIVDYSLSWFKKNSFTQYELNSLEKTKDNLFLKKGIYFSAIIWPPAFDFKEDIKYEISSQYKIKHEIDLSYAGKEFEDFIRFVYSLDDISLWKVNKKISFMSQYQKTVSIIFLEIGYPDYRTKTNGHIISGKVENLKKEIRNKFKYRIEDYHHDVIFHVGDNPQHNKVLYEFLASKKLV